MNGDPIQGEQRKAFGDDTEGRFRIGRDPRGIDLIPAGRCVLPCRELTDLVEGPFRKMRDNRLMNVLYPGRKEVLP